MEACTRGRHIGKEYSLNDKCVSGGVVSMESLGKGKLATFGACLLPTSIKKEKDIAVHHARW
jgi:hypothetical protein